MRRLTGIAGLGALALPLALAGASLPAAAQPLNACDGVVVVVDFTDLGGDVVTGCAEGDPSSGREALEMAGFTPADGDTPGLICTIDAQPDPCPTTFEGSYWAYWSAPDYLTQQWEMSMTGADETDPAPGQIEGWRYNDGSVPPSLAPNQVPTIGDALVESPAASATEDPSEPATEDPSEPATEDPSEPATEEPSEPATDEAPAIPPWAGIVIALALLGTGVAMAIRLRRRQ